MSYNAGHGKCDKKNLQAKIHILSDQETAMCSVTFTECHTLQPADLTDDLWRGIGEEGGRGETLQKQVAASDWTTTMHAETPCNRSYVIGPTLQTVTQNCINISMRQ